MDLGTLAAHLSCVVSSQNTVHAAQAFLGLPDPSNALGRMYTFLVWQRTLRVALGHLDAAGADLDALEIPREAVLQTFPHGYRPLWDVRLEPPITARDIIGIYDRHRRLLTEPVLRIVDCGVTGFVAVSGRAHAVRYPAYQHRVEFDTDLVVADHEAAAEITAVLTHAGYDLDTMQVRRLGESQDGTVEIRQQIQGHRVSVGLLVGGYHAHRGPIAERGDLMPFHNREVPVAQPADMLVMLAARVERKRRFAFVNFNDAAVILQTDGDRLDWELVRAAAAAARVEVTLAVVLERAERVLSRKVVPGEVYARLRGSSQTRMRLRLTRQVADETVALVHDAHGFDTPNTAVWRAWLATVRLSQHRRRDAVSLTNRVALRVQRRILRAQLKRMRAGRPVKLVDASLTRMRTRCGAFCEIAPHLAAPERCLSVLGSRLGPTPLAGGLRTVAKRYEPAPGDHDCSRLRFEIATRHLI